MDRLLVLAHGATRVGVWFGGALIIASAFLVGIEVVIRRAFDLTIGGADELSGFALAISTAFGLSFALLERAHIRIDSLYVHLPVRLCAVLDVLGLIAFIGFFGLISWHAAGVVDTTWRLGARSMSPLATPLILPQALWLLGLVMFLAIALLLLVRALLALLSGDVTTVQRLAGSRTVSEEVEVEIDEVASARQKRELEAGR